MVQPSLFEQEITVENPDFLTKQIITQMVNKRSLLPFIEEAVNVVKRRLGKAKIVAFEWFCRFRHCFSAAQSALLSSDF